MKNQKILLIIVVTSLIFSSCKKELFKDNSLSKAELSFAMSTNPIVVFAEALNEAQQNEPELREFIKMNALIGIHDEPVVLFSLVKDSLINSSFGSITFDELLGLYCTNCSSSFFNDIVLIHKKLGIAVYAGYDEDDKPELWNTEENTSVSFVLFDEEIGETKMFHINQIGDYNEIDEFEAPETAYLVVDEYHEFIFIDQTSMLIDGESFSEFLAKNAATQENCEIMLAEIIYFLNNNGGFISVITSGNPILIGTLSDMLNAYFELCVPPPPPLPGYNSGQNCNRDNRNNREALTKIQIPNRSDRRASRKWHSNTYRIRATAVFGSYPSNPSVGNEIRYLVCNKKDLSNGKVHTFSSAAEFIKWNLDDFADIVKYSFIAENKKSGTEKTRGIKIPASAKFKVNGVDVSLGVELNFTSKFTVKDYDFGEQAIYYCDQANNDQVYDTGTNFFKFWIKEL